VKEQTTRKQHLRDICKTIPEKINSMLETLISKLHDNLIVVWFVTQNTLTVVAMALLILSPMIVWPFLMNWREPYCYLAYAIWIAWFIGSCILAAVVGYLREKANRRE
jgi:Mg2+ and Co2+ transporter CorA